MSAARGRRSTSCRRGAAAAGRTGPGARRYHRPAPHLPELRGAARPPARAAAVPPRPAAQVRAARRVGGAGWPRGPGPGEAARSPRGGPAGRPLPRAAPLPPGCSHAPPPRWGDRDRPAGVGRPGALGPGPGPRDTLPPAGQGSAAGRAAARQPGLEQSALLVPAGPQPGASPHRLPSRSDPNLGEPGGGLPWEGLPPVTRRCVPAGEQLGPKPLLREAQR